MGISFSQVFELVNDIHIVIGSGALGILIFVRNGMSTHIFKTFSVAGLTAASLFYVFSGAELLDASSKKIVFITGCDSGLGFSLAHHACEMGFTVFAGCLNVSSDGARELNKIFYKDISLIELDVTNQDSVEQAFTIVEKYLIDHPENEFWALVNNAGVMVFGEFEWQTERLIRNQIEVNLLGTMRMTKRFCPLLRNYSGRIINVSSHCAHATLPGLAVYGASKAGLSAWNDGLRVELNKYGINVVTFVPGSFIQQSNIMSKQNENVYEMQSAMSREQLNFYGDYFKQFNTYLSVLSGTRAPKKIVDYKMYEIFERTLLEEKPKSEYLHEPWRYTIYHILFKITPTFIRDYLILKFVQLPKWEKEKKVANVSDIIA